MSSPNNPTCRPSLVVLVGHCGPDSSYLRYAIHKVSPEAMVESADTEDELQHLMGQKPALVLLNREIGWGFSTSSGVELVRQIHATYPQSKVMMVSNYPQTQSEAVENGALPGFGKRELSSPKVLEILRSALC